MAMSIMVFSGSFFLVFFPSTFLFVFLEGENILCAHPCIQGDAGNQINSLKGLIQNKRKLSTSLYVIARSKYEATYVFRSSTASILSMTTNRVQLSTSGVGTTHNFFKLNYLSKLAFQNDIQLSENERSNHNKLKNNNALKN